MGALFKIYISTHFLNQDLIFHFPLKHFLLFDQVTLKFSPKNSLSKSTHSLSKNKDQTPLKNTPPTPLPLTLHSPTPLSFTLLQTL